MFVLLTIKDAVPVPPKTLDIAPNITITDSLNKKYANKLIPEKGLGVSVYDLLTAEEGRVTWGNGMMYYKVSFRLLTFAPFVGEVLIGRVMNTTKAYVRVSLGFFHDIYIYPSHLATNSAYDPVEKKYFWYSEPENRILNQVELINTVKDERLYIDPGENIRIRVDSIEWQEVRPLPVVDVNYGPDGQPIALPEIDPIERAGFKIVATIAEAGLGITQWWEGQDEDEELAEE